MVSHRAHLGFTVHKPVSLRLKCKTNFKLPVSLSSWDMAPRMLVIQTYHPSNLNSNVYIFLLIPKVLEHIRVTELIAVHELAIAIFVVIIGILYYA